MPRKKVNREREKHFQVRLTEEEFEMLENKAKGFGLTKTEYIRKLIVFGRVRPKSKLTDEQFREMLLEMNHIGTNINQIAYRVNAARNANKDDYMELKVAYHSLLDLFRSWAK